MLATSPAEGLLRFELTDGTVITGRMERRHVRVKTAAGVKKVPAGEIVELVAGMDSRPELARRVKSLIEGLGSPVWKRREAAQKELIEMGPCLRPILEMHKGDEDLERRTRIKAILEAYRSRPAGHLGAAGLGGIAIPAQGQVRTDNQAMVGRIMAEHFKVATRCGELTVKLGELRRASRAKPWTPPARCDKPVAVALHMRSGKSVRGTTKLSLLPLATRYGDLRVPLWLIRSAVFGDDKKTVEMLLCNGDRLHGVLAKRLTVAVETESGRVAVPMDTVARLWAGGGLGPGQAAVLVKGGALPGQCKHIRRATMLYNEQKGLFQTWCLAVDRPSGRATRYAVYFGEFEARPDATLRNVKMVMSGSYARYETEGLCNITVVRDRKTGTYNLWAHSYYTKGWKCEIRHFTSADGLKWAERAKTHTAGSTEDYETPVAVQLSNGTTRLYYSHQSRDSQPRYLVWSDIPPGGDKPTKRVNTGVRMYSLEGAAAFSDSHHALLVSGRVVRETLDGGKTWPVSAKPVLNGQKLVPATMYYHKGSDSLLFVCLSKDGSLVLARARRKSAGGNGPAQGPRRGG